MKMMLSVCMLLIQFTLVGQDKLMVYQVKGKVLWQATLQQKPRPLKIGEQVAAQSSVTIEKGGSLMLLCSNYQPLLVNTVGKTELAGLLGGCVRSPKSVSAAYFRYVWNEFTHAHTAPEANRRKYMRNVGGAVRGCPGISYLIAVDSLFHYKEQFLIRWQTNIDAKRISVRVYDQEKGGLLLAQFAPSGNYFSTEVLVKAAGNNDVLYWTLAIDGNETCERNFIAINQEEEYNAVLQAASEESSEFLNEAEKHFLTAFLLETRGFIGEALVYYKKALAKDDTNKRYQKAVDELSKTSSLK